jgi:hypothetical protein
VGQVGARPQGDRRRHLVAGRGAGGVNVLCGMERTLRRIGSSRENQTRPSAQAVSAAEGLLTRANEQSLDSSPRVPQFVGRREGLNSGVDLRERAFACDAGVCPWPCGVAGEGV